jgi:hypothetical protein
MKTLKQCASDPEAGRERGTESPKKDEGRRTLKQGASGEDEDFYIQISRHDP